MHRAVKSKALHHKGKTVDALLRGNALPHLEKTMLLAFATGSPRAALLAVPERIVSDDDAAAFASLAARRAAGEPIAYLVGRREFHGISLAVSPAVLIPRPETELVVDAVLARVAIDDAARVLDVGTGSGAIAIAIARARPRARIVAVDTSAAALGIARDNARDCFAANVDLRRSDWFAAVAGERFDVVASNPPYVAARDPHLADGDLRFEPVMALVGGDDGLDALRTIVGGAPRHLVPGGWLVVEHGFDQGAAVRHLATSAGFVAVATLVDLGGHERVCVARQAG